MVKSSKALLMIVKGERIVRQMPVASCVQRKNFKSTADDELDMLLLLAVSEDQVFFPRQSIQQWLSRWKLHLPIFVVHSESGTLSNCLLIPACGY